MPINPENTILKKAIDSSPYGVFVCVEQKIAYVNFAAEKMLGIEVGQICAQALFGLAKCPNCPADMENPPLITTRQIIKKDSNNNDILFDIDSSLFDDHEGNRGVSHQVFDVTPETKQIQKLEYQATHDSLTGLLNKFALEKKIEELKKQKIKNIGIVIGDIDSLKKINDLFGHQTGDNYIRYAADFLKLNFRDEDEIYRYGGDEFVVFIQNINHAQLKAKLKIVKTKLDEFNDTYKLCLMFSFGGVLVPSDQISKGIERADAKMYNEKQKTKQIELNNFFY